MSLRRPNDLEDSSSPESTPAAFLIANAAATAGGDDAGLYLNNESSSPSPESDKPMFIERRPKLSQAAARKMAARNSAALTKSTKAAAGKSTAGSSKSRQPPPPPNAVIPKRAEDWEPWKGILHELYITQNRILKDIIAIMENTYNLRATPKMYKNQFARWNFFKYAIKRRPRTKAERDAEKSSEDELALVTTSPTTASPPESLMTPLLHPSNPVRVMQGGLTAVRDFLRGYIDVDETVSKDIIVMGYEDPCFRYFKAAIDLIDQDEVAEGGLVLRLGFLELERMLQPLTLKNLSDLLFLVPHLLVESQRKDILTSYLRYLAQIASVRFPNHPINNIIASLSDLVDQPEELMRYIVTLSQVNADTISTLPGMKDRTRKWARNQHSACERTTDEGVIAGRGTHPHKMIRVESQSVYWAQNLLMNDPESDRLAELWLRRDFPDDFEEKSLAYLEKVNQMGQMGYPPQFVKIAETVYVGWLADYYEDKEDWPNVWEYGQRGLSMAAGEQYQLWSLHLEELMRKHGAEEQAEVLKKRRREHEWFEEVRGKLDNLTL